MDSHAPFPPTSAPLAAEAWEQYRVELEDWAARWDAWDLEQSRNSALKNMSVFQWHPNFKGQIEYEVALRLRQEARRAQVVYKLFQTRPKQLSEEIEVIEVESRFLSRVWSPFGGGDWTQMSDRDLEDYSRRSTPGQQIGWVEPNDWVDMVPAILARNRFQFESLKDRLERENFTVADYAKYLRVPGSFANETNVALYLRKSRPYALVLGIAALLISLLTQNAFAKVIGVVALGYLLLSYWLHPRALLRDGSRSF